MAIATLPAFPNLSIIVRNGVVEFPVHHMRGGTSTGVVIWDQFAPQDSALKEELARHLMGVPLDGKTSPGNRQITGLGRGAATSNKVFFADIEQADGSTRVVSTLAQLASDHGQIDWSVNCGNMSASLPLWALDSGIMEASVGAGALDIDIRNTNTGILTTARMAREVDGVFVPAEIPGVDGAFPSVDLFLHNPVGSKTGKLLPTGNVIDVIEGYDVSCVDAAVPMVILDAAQLGKTAHEPYKELDADKPFIETLRRIWVEAGLRMGLKKRDGSPMTADELARSETVPKVCMVSAPRAGGTLSVRYFTPQTAHSSMAVSGACCLATAALIPGTTAYRFAQGLPQPGPDFADIAVALENPAGMMDAVADVRLGAHGLEVRKTAYRRNAQVLLRGHVPLYRASEALKRALLG